jgi:hypothetical protein
MGFREDGEHHMVLYRVDDFYIEIHYHTAQNEITGRNGGNAKLGREKSL